MPDLPGSSSAEPTLNQSMWVTTGARRSGITTTSSPLSSVNFSSVQPGAVHTAPFQPSPTVSNMKSVQCAPAGAAVVQLNAQSFSREVWPYALEQVAHGLTAGSDTHE